MIGIYRLYDKETGKSYIGQSRDIEERIREHFWHRNSNTASYVDKCIGEIGENRFVYEVLKECDPSELDYWEDYFISKYDSRNNGFNIAKGGQHNIGESNANAKLTEQDVYDIREAYGNLESKDDTYEKYKDKISRSYFSNIWEGKIWDSIHKDVYTEENKEFYCKPKNKNTITYSDAQIHKFRVRYANGETAAQIYNSIEKENRCCTFDTFRNLMSGNIYSYIPTYDKKKHEWKVTMEI